MFALMSQQLVEVSVAHLGPPAAGQGAGSALLCPSSSCSQLWEQGRSPCRGVWREFWHHSFVGLIKDEFQITCNTTGVWSVCMLLKKYVTDKNEIAK